MTESVTLRGISWDHPRGLGPLLTTAPAYEAQRPTVRIDWEARSLLRFGEDPLEELAERYDLLVIDHPFIGYGAGTGHILPLDGLLPGATLRSLEDASVGPSYLSYVWDGRTWALPIDAAAQVSAQRTDLLDATGLASPSTWDAVLRLGSQLRKAGLSMGMPMIHTDLVPTFYTLAANLGEEPLRNPSVAVLSWPHLDRVLDLLLGLRDACESDLTELDPPTLLDRMADGDDIAYCPLLFGYSNYARTGFRRVPVTFGDIPSATRQPSGATLGGAGIAISSRCAQPAAAAEYAAWLASGPVQRGGYLAGGGQPAHRSAWTDGPANDLTGGFFQATLRSMDLAFLRPRWPGYMEFQDRAGPLLRDFVRGKLGRHELISGLDSARHESQRLRLELMSPGDD